MENDHLNKLFRTSLGGTSNALLRVIADDWWSLGSAAIFFWEIIKLLLTPSVVLVCCVCLVVLFFFWAGTLTWPDLWPGIWPGPDHLLETICYCLFCSVLFLYLYKFVFCILQTVDLPCIYLYKLYFAVLYLQYLYKYSLQYCV